MADRDGEQRMENLIWSRPATAELSFESFSASEGLRAAVAIAGPREVQLTVREKLERDTRNEENEDSAGAERGRERRG